MGFRSTVIYLSAITDSGNVSNGRQNKKSFEQYSKRSLKKQINMDIKDKIVTSHQPKSK